MPEYLDTYLELADVEKHNPFISRKPNTAELPDFESNRDKLPEPVWDGHPDSIEAYYKAWKIAFSNLGKPAKDDFVGWTGIIPTTVFIEYILGIQVHAERNEIVWHVKNLECHGIKRIPVGRDAYADLICEARNDESEKPSITVTSDKPIKVTVIYGDNKFMIGE